MNNFSKIIIITILLSINAFSQKLSEMRTVGNAEFLSSELIDKNIKDANSETCAGLIIQSDLTGLNYTSYNGIVKINKKPGQDLLFLSQDERVVTIFAEGFSPLKIILNDYGIKLESGKVWQIKITGEKKNIVNLIPVNFLIEPSEAEIFINGESKGIEQSQKLPAGDYTLRIEKKGYKPINEKIKISADNSLFKYNLKAIDLIPVTIKSIPDQAQITLDNQDIGLTNNGYFLYPGTYKLKIIKSGYLDVERTIAITEQGTNEFQDSLVKNTGTLSIMVIPNNSEIFINKFKRANLPGNFELAPGKYKIEIRKGDYYPKDEIIEIKQGEIAARNYKLDEITGNALIKITPIEAKCNLVKNGKVIDSWVGLKNLKNIQTGNYIIEAELSGFNKLTKEIQINKNETTNIELIMIKGDERKADNFQTKKEQLFMSVKIGNQTWMAENLNIDHFRNGDIIPEAKTNEEWENAKNNHRPAWCYYNNDCENGVKYGKLYNWYAVKDPRGLAPKGWHIPTQEEFKTLSEAVSGDGNVLKSVGQGSGEGAGTNTSGFSAIMSGYRKLFFGAFHHLDDAAEFWGAGDYENHMALDADNSSLTIRFSSDEFGYSVRCVKY